ncbi:hypothetical protein [uncultured Bifidobacterium sp.]|uniref:hypothetical protein n=1 Tax=uncultured Bifidobacterium sp. TaxID=165187 RepID=UPI00259451ED|nr:hypothetical protein [uncultured Bifidobacterium sp.]
MTTATTNTNIDSDNMNTGATNGGATKGASSDGDLDFQGTANAAGEGSRCGCGCGCTKDDAAKQADKREGAKSNETPQPAEPVNPFPPQQAPSGDGTGVKAGGEQAE